MTGVMLTVRSLETAPGANVTVALPSALVTLPPAGVTIPWPAGGDNPLAVFAVGSGATVAHEAGAVVAPSVCAEGVAPTGAPLPESEEALPELLVDPATGELVGQPEMLGLLSLLVVPLTAATVTPESSVETTLASIVPLSPVTPWVVGVFGATLSDSVPLPPRPTSAWVIAEAVGVVEAVLPEEMSAGAALEIWPESFDVAVESVVAVEKNV